MGITATAVDVDVARAPIVEASGLAFDRSGLWIHNDSGDGPHLWWWHPGVAPVEWRLPGAPARDWEDICIGTAPDRRTPSLWIADTGSARTGQPMTMLACPLPPDPAAGGTLAWTAYPFTAKGLIDCEAVFASWTSGLYAVSKRARSGRADVWHLPIAGDIIRPRLVATIALELATAADLSPDGTRLAVRNYDRVLIWDRRPGESTVSMLLRPADHELVDHAGSESIAWESDSAWWTIPEGVGSHLRRWTLT